MGLEDILGSLMGGGQAAPEQPENQFDKISSMLPSGVLGQGLSALFGSSETPAFGQLAGQLFGNSSSDQKAGLLNTLLSAAGPMLAGGAGASLLSQLAGGGQRALTPEEAENVSPELVNQLASHAEKHDSSILDTVGSFYSEHPGLVKTLGGGLLSFVLAKVATSNR
jgi:hypothetical protein